MLCYVMLCYVMLCYVMFHGNHHGGCYPHMSSIHAQTSSRDQFLHVLCSSPFPKRLPRFSLPRMMVPRMTGLFSLRAEMVQDLIILSFLPVSRRHNALFHSASSVELP
jgi:hypothetical protein